MSNFKISYVHVVDIKGKRDLIADFFLAPEDVSTIDEAYVFARRRFTADGITPMAIYVLDERPLELRCGDRKTFETYPKLLSRTCMDSREDYGPENPIILLGRTKITEEAPVAKESSSEAVQ